MKRLILMVTIVVALLAVAAPVSAAKNYHAGSQRLHYTYGADCAVCAVGVPAHFTGTGFAPNTTYTVNVYESGVSYTFTTDAGGNVDYYWAPTVLGSNTGYVYAPNAKRATLAYSVYGV